MASDLAYVALLSIFGLSASVGVTVAAEIELLPDLVAIEALAISEPAAIDAQAFLERAIRVRGQIYHEALLTAY